MKKLVVISVVGAALALGACASKGKSTDYSYEKQAPYADGRTAGGGTSQELVGKTTADKVFSKSQHK